MCHPPARRPEVYGVRAAIQQEGADGLPKDPPKLIFNLSIAGEAPVTIDLEVGDSLAPILAPALPDSRGQY